MIMRCTPFGLSILLVLGACGGEHAEDPGHAHPHPHPPGQAHGHEHGDDGADHGARADLGTLEVAGHRFRLTRFGDMAPGAESAIEVRLEGAAPGASGLSLYVWVEDAGGTQLSAPAKGRLADGTAHFHVAPRAGGPDPVRAVLRVRTGDIDERGALPLDGHGHAHAPHDGVMAAFRDPAGALAGHLELVLHDDKGDLELWLSADEAQTRPFDLPLDASVRVRFPDLQGREVVLRPRDRDRNEDENGVANVRAGRTNYFIYPSAAGEDASWLRGKAFRARATVHFERDGQPYRSEELVLVPHTHGH